VNDQWVIEEIGRKYKSSWNPVTMKIKPTRIFEMQSNREIARNKGFQIRKEEVKL
jgi:hypothetical protein